MVKNMILKRMIFGLATASVLAWTGVAYSAPVIDGSWQVTEALGSAGPHGLGTFNESRNEVSKSVEIAQGAVKIGSAVCRIENSQTITLSDYEFGNEKGDWSSLGFTPLENSPYEYEAAQINLACPGYSQSTREILIGAGNSPVVLNYWETWLKLDRIEP